MNFEAMKETIRNHIASDQKSLTENASGKIGQFMNDYSTPLQADNRIWHYIALFKKNNFCKGYQAIRFTLEFAPYYPKGARTLVSYNFEEKYDCLYIELGFLYQIWLTELGIKASSLVLVTVCRRDLGNWSKTIHSNPPIVSITYEGRSFVCS